MLRQYEINRLSLFLESTLFNNFVDFLQYNQPGIFHGCRLIAEESIPLDNSGSDSRNLIGQLQVSKRGRNLERDSKCQWGGF